MTNKLKVEKVTEIAKRCPQCKELSLEFDVKSGVLKCTKCNFEQKLKVYQEVF